MRQAGARERCGRKAAVETGVTPEKICVFLSSSILCLPGDEIFPCAQEDVSSFLPSVRTFVRLSVRSFSRDCEDTIKLFRGSPKPTGHSGFGVCAGMTPRAPRRRPLYVCASTPVWPCLRRIRRRCRNAHPRGCLSHPSDSRPSLQPLFSLFRFLRMSWHFSRICEDMCVYMYVRKEKKVFSSLPL